MCPAAPLGGKHGQREENREGKEGRALVLGIAPVRILQVKRPA